MNPRWSILLAALLGASCSTNNKNAALVITKLVLGTAETLPGPPPQTFCKYDPAGVEFDFAQINPSANSGGTMGVVVQNNLADTTRINPDLRTNSSRFNPRQVVASYEVIGGPTVSTQIIPVSGSVPSGGGTGAVLVPFFSPVPVTMLSGIIRVTFHIEGRLDDGSNVRTGERDYIFVTCSAAGCNSACL
jgi:hypothetical protein